jgi:hypothetical protein
MRFLRSHLLAALTTVVLVAGPVAASATTLQIDLGGESVGLGDLTTSYTPTTYGGVYTLTAPYAGTNGTISQWSSAYDTDPFVTQNFTVTNPTGVTQTYVFTVTSPIVPQLPTTLMSGSVGLTITNTADASATLDDNGNAVYTALIDGGSVQTLFDPAYSLSCTPAFCSNSQSTDFGIPVPIGGPGATTSIGIRIQFDLSPGDSAGVTSVFNIVAIPEPVTGALLGAGVLALALAGRRRA